MSEMNLPRFAEEISASNRSADADAARFLPAFLNLLVRTTQLNQAIQQ